MAEEEGNVSLVVDATDGGYILASFSSPPAYAWVPTEYSDQPGGIAASEHVATINTLGSEGHDERVLLSCILLNRPLTEREVDRRGNQGAHIARFRLVAAGPIWVLANSLEEQGVIASDLVSTIELECCVFMVLEPDKLYPADPVEQHHLRMWPADRTARVRPWWMAPTRRVTPPSSG